MANNKYRPSGGASVFGVVCMIVFGLIGSVILLAAYVHGVQFMPNMGLRVLVFLVALFLLSGLMRRLTRAAKLRAPGKAFWLTFLIMLLALYAASIVFVVFVHNAWEYSRADFLRQHFTVDSAEKMLYLLLHPKALYESLSTIIKTGFFTVRGESFREARYLILLIVEALFFLLVPSFRAMGQGFKVFSEVQNRWLNQTIEFTCAYIKEHRTLRRQMIKGDFSGLDQIHYYKVQGQEAHGTVTFYHHKGQLGPYVSMQMVKAVQIGPRRVKHFYIPILEQWDLGDEKREEIFTRLLAESGLTRERVTARKGNYKERLFWRSSKDRLTGTIRERVERSSNRVELRDSGAYRNGEEAAGIEEVTVYAPTITPEMEQEYLAKKAREEQEKIWAQNREEVKNRKKKSKRRSTTIK